MSLRIAIVGCGNIADGHAEEVAKIPGATLVALCDREPLMAEQLSVRSGGVPYYQSLDELLEAASPDVVHITTPPQSHVALASEAIDAGCHVFVEKPLALNAEDAAGLVELAQDRARLLTVGYIYQFDPPAVRMRRLIAKGVLGDPVDVDVRYGYNLEGSFGRAVMANPSHWVHDLPGRLFQNNLDHAVSKIVEFLPEGELDVRAVAYRTRTEEYGDRRDDVLDELRATVVCGGVSGSIQFSCGARPVAHSVTVRGTRNTVHVDLSTRTVVFERWPHLPSALGRVLPAFSQGWEFTREGFRNGYRFARSRFHYFAGMNTLMRMFYAAIREGGAPPIPYRDIIRSAEIMDAIVEQVYGGTRPGSSP